MPEKYACGLNSDILCEGKCPGKHKPGTTMDVLMMACFDPRCPAYDEDFHEVFYHGMEACWTKENPGDGLTEFKRVRNPEYIRAMEIIKKQMEIRRAKKEIATEEDKIEQILSG